MDRGLNSIKVRLIESQTKNKFSTNSSNSYDENHKEWFISK